MTMTMAPASNPLELLFEEDEVETVEIEAIPAVVVIGEEIVEAVLEVFKEETVECGSRSG